MDKILTKDEAEICKATWNSSRLDKLAKDHTDFVAWLYDKTFKHGYKHGWEDAFTPQYDKTDFRTCPPHPGCIKTS
jgi:hypothetical protein